MNGSEVVNMASTIQVRVEDELKRKSEVLGIRKKYNKELLINFIVTLKRITIKL